MQHVIRATDLSTTELSRLFARTADFKQRRRPDGVVALDTLPLSGRTVITCFYQPSTRTRLSFEAAALALGAGITGTENAAEFSSAIKGETLEDTVRVMSGYGHALVLRHPEVGAAERARSVSSVPVINAGDGTGEHPTQAFLDLFTIVEHFGSGRPLSLTFVGDLARGRTVHSLVRLLGACQGALVSVERITFVAPENMQLPDDLLAYATETFKTVVTHNALSEEVLRESTVVYMTRPQNEYGKKAAYEGCVLTPSLAAHLPKDAVLLHPLPRNSELPPEIDSDPRARYFEQAQNGLYLRMALLELVLS